MEVEDAFPRMVVPRGNIDGRKRRREVGGPEVMGIPPDDI